MAYNLALVEDHDVLRNLIAEALTERGHKVSAFSSAEDLDELGSVAPIDIFLLDLNLPGEDGLTLSKRLRAAYPLAGIIMVTARVDLADRITGYDSGADLYMPKPIEIDELCAAVESLGRRRNAHGRLISAESENQFTLNQTTLILSKSNEQSVALTPAEAQIINAFAKAPGQRLATWQVVQALGADPEQQSKGSLEVRITRLRKKLLQIGAHAGCIEAVRGEGYQLCIPLVLI